MFVPDKPFQPGIMFVGKAKTHSGKLKFYLQTGNAGEKHSSLFQTLVNYGHNFFITLTSGVVFKALNFFVTYKWD